MKANDCFNCRNHGEGEKADDPGIYHPCKLKIPNDGLADVNQCKSSLPNKGFSMGGYYTHTHFEKDGECLKLIIHGDLQFPKDDPYEWTEIHICDFDEIKKWVDFWDKELKKKP